MINVKNEAATFALAVQFLTRAPIGFQNAYSEKRMAASVKYYPLVGVLVGAVCAAVFVLSQTVLPVTVSVILAIAAGVLCTGAFHEDGLADTFDGVGGGASRSDAMEIMKDSRLGAYGALALVIAIAIKIALLSSLSFALVSAALIAAHGLSRLSSVLVIATSRYVREEGTAKPVSQGISANGLMVAGLTGAAIVFAWMAFLPSAAILWSLFGLVIAHGLMRLFFEPKLGGYTGDALGAVQQASEIGFYIGLCAWAL